MADLMKKYITGKSGKEYTFKYYPLGTDFNNIGAIYIYCNKPCYNDNFSFIFIGNTYNLSGKFNYPDKKECIKKNKPNCLLVLENNCKKTRLIIEKDIIMANVILCNKINKE